MKEQLLLQLMDEYFDQFGDINIILEMQMRLGIDFAIEMLQGRNGQEIVPLYLGEKYDDVQPEYIYE